jgi:hypothetical protein
VFGMIETDDEFIYIVLCLSVLEDEKLDPRGKFEKIIFISLPTEGGSPRVNLGGTDRFVLFPSHKVKIEFTLSQSYPSRGVSDP